MHSEMFTDGLFELCAAGKVTNAKKTHPPWDVGDHLRVSVRRRCTTSSTRIPTIGVAPVFYTNDPSVIAKNHRMVSINSALEVDLQGQIVADTIGRASVLGRRRAHGLRRRDESLARAHLADLPAIDRDGQR